MTDRDILIELLAIKLHEHSQTVDWIRLDPVDRAMYRNLIASHHTAEGLLSELNEE